MPDETDTTVASETDTTTASTTETTVAPTMRDFINDDGTFKEGWKAALVPEDFRQRKVYDVFTDIKGLMKQLGHQDKLIGAQGKGILPLGPTPTPTEVEVYRKAIGVPETPEGYGFQVPEGLADYYDDAAVAETLKAFHDANLTPGQVAAVMALDAKRIRDGIKEQEEAEVNARAEAEATLRQDWGEKFDENLRLANRVVAENVAEEDKEELLALIGNNVMVAKLFATLGTAYLEDTVTSTDSERATGITSEIDKLEATPGYATGELKRTNRKEHDRIVERLAFLYKRKYPNPAPTT